MLKHNSILIKISTLFILIAFPIILFIGYLLILDTRKTTANTLENYAFQHQKYVEMLDTTLLHTYTQVTTILSHSEIDHLTFLSSVAGPYQTYQSTMALLEYTSGIVNQNIFLKDINIYINNTNSVYHSKKNSSEKITDETYNYLANLTVTSPSQFVMRENSLIMLIKSSIQNPTHIVEAEISLDQLNKEFKTQSNYNHSYFIFDFQNENYILNNIQDSDIYHAALSAQYENGISLFTANGQYYYGFLANFKNIDAVYIQVFPKSSITQNPLNIYAIVVILFLMVSVIIFFVGTKKMIQVPLNHLMNAFQVAESNILHIRINECSNDEFNYLYKGFNNMMERLEMQINELYHQKLLLQQAEFKQLQAQINPHFLYNSFFLLQRLIQADMMEESLKIANHLKNHFKYITQNQTACVQLKDEYIYAKNYSDIQSMRFEGRINIEFDELPSDYAYCEIPRLIIQPIIENAFEHGLKNKYSDGLLRIRFHTGDNGLAITVEDNGEELTDEKLLHIENVLHSSVHFSESDEITALSNISLRLQLFYKCDSSIKVSRSQIGGLNVTIFLTKERYNQHETNANN